MTINGPSAMPWSVFLSTIFLVAIYLGIHRISVHLLSPSRAKRVHLADLSEHSHHPLKGKSESTDCDDSPISPEVINPISRPKKKPQDEEFVTIDFQ